MLLDFIDVKEIDKHDKNSDIAIIGIGINLPFSKDLNEFWNHIANGDDLISRISELRRKDILDFQEYIHDYKCNIEEGGFLEEIDKFDYKFFNLTPREASLMDPNQRIFLETTWRAIEDSGYGNNKLKGTKTGVYVGYCNENMYKQVISKSEPELISLSTVGNLAPVIASRISYILDLNGPSMLINTACSSSLVALHTACQAIKHKECDMSIVGGVQVHVIPIRKELIGVESKDNRTKTFDNEANGVSGGEGAISIIIKPLKKAVIDKDNIYAIIKGSSVNQDGKCMSLSAPNPIAQENVLVDAWHNANIDPSEISYIESHGTATKLGDAIEIEGINNAFLRFTEKKQFCGIGSVKSNIGHLDGVAGLLGLLKVIVSLNNKKIPPTIHFKRPNKNIPFYKSPVYVNNRLKYWETINGKRLAGVSSFGMSGTNCHVVLEEYENRYDVKNSNKFSILAISANSESSLRKIISKYRYVDVQKLGLDNICYTANTGRTHHKFRVILIIKGIQDYYDKINYIHENDLNNISSKYIYYSNYNINYYDLENLNAEADNLIKVKNKDIETLCSLCNLYIKGADINFDKFYANKSLNKVTLPVYEFDKTRCWVDFKNTNDNKYFNYEWAESDNLTENYSVNINHKCLILRNCDSNENNQFIEEMKNGMYDVTTVKIKNNSDEISEKTFINLFDSVNINEFNKIIFLNNLGNSYETTNYLDFIQRFKNSYYYFYYLSKAIIDRVNNNLELIIVSEYGQKVDNSEKVIIPENAAIYSLGKVLNQEKYKFKCRSLDVDDKTSVKSVITEIESEKCDYLVAYRSDKRYVQRLIDINIKNYTSENYSLKEGSTVVILGGLGSIGREISRYLTYKEKINLVIIGKTRIPNEIYWDNIINANINNNLIDKINYLKMLKLSANSVTYITADICDYNLMQKSINNIVSTFGNISGAINCTGFGIGVQGEKISDMPKEIFDKILESKIYGTWIINNLLNNIKLDFFIVLSSPITMTGGIGIGSYSSANAYIDSLVDLRNLKHEKSFSISLAPWKHTVETVSIDNFNENEHLFKLLTPSDLISSLDTILNTSIEKIIIGKLNLNSYVFDLKDVLPFKISDQLISKRNAFNSDANISSNNTLKHSKKKKISNTLSNIENVILGVYSHILGYKNLRIKDNYYELGGDSIIAVQIANKLTEELELKIDSVEVLKNPILEDLIKIIKSKKVCTKTENKDETINEISKYKASSAQKRLFLINQNKNVGTSWNITYLMKFIGKLNIKKLESTFNELIERHEILRTNIIMQDGTIYQKIKDKIEFKISILEGNIDLEDIIKKNSEDVYDISNDILFRVTIIEKSEDLNIMLFDINHIISDEISMDIIMNELSKIYNNEELPEMKIQYKDYSEWQNNNLESGDINNQQKYWMDIFKGKIDKIEFPLDYKRPLEKSFHASTLYFECDLSISKKVNNIITQENITLNWFLLSILFIALSKYCSKEEFVINMPIYGRKFPGSEILIGMFVNVLPIKNNVSGNKTYIEFLNDVKKSVIDAYENQDYPYEELLKHLKYTSTNGQDPLSDICFNMHKKLIQEVEFSKDINMEPIYLQSHNTNQDLMLEVYEDKHIIKGSFLYCDKLFKESTIKNFMDLYKFIIEQVLNNTNIYLKDIRTIHPDKLKQVVDSFNDNLFSDMEMKKL